VVVVVDLVAVTLVVVVVSKAAGSMVTDKLQVVLAPAEVASALAACAAQVAPGTLRAQDLASRRLGIHRMHSLNLMVLAHKLCVRQSQGSRIGAFQAFATTS
jgi:hypothetical protein